MHMCIHNIYIIQRIDIRNDFELHCIISPPLPAKKEDNKLSQAVLDASD